MNDSRQIKIKEALNEVCYQVSSNIKKFRILIVTIAILVFILIFSIFTAPGDFAPVTVEIQKGDSIREIAKTLEVHNVIRSKTIFTVLVHLSDKKTASAGEYVFESPQNIFRVADRLANSEYGQNTVTVTLTEGMTVLEMSEVLRNNFKKFDPDKFIELSTGEEGYLFPDTYKFNEGAEADEIYMALRENFDTHLKEIADVIESSPYSLSEIIKMASIIEKEATADTRQEVGNILWRRYEIGMALQVDAAFVYSIGKSTFELTEEDLRSDNPYNTYVNVGLPPTPIANPGLDSIIAAANPQKTSNLYFITGRDGKMYFAKNFEEHKRNRALYLD